VPDQETLQTMPGAAGDMRLGADVMPASLHQEGRYEEIEAAPRPRLKRRTVEEAASAFVPPIRPDDPGTEDIDSLPESSIRGGEE
jgi:hypothetical protein